VRVRASSARPSGALPAGNAGDRPGGALRSITDTVLASVLVTYMVRVDGSIALKFGPSPVGSVPAPGCACAVSQLWPAPMRQAGPGRAWAAAAVIRNSSVAVTTTRLQRMAFMPGTVLRSGNAPVIRRSCRGDARAGSVAREP